MTSSDPPERKQTDESLAVERAKADHAIAEKAAAIADEANVVIERAREEADDVLTVARAKADEKLKHSDSAEQARIAVAQERARADKLLEEERLAADEVLQRARAHAANIARLLPVEREKTDLYLQTERARSDEALVNRDDFLGMVSHDLRDLLNGVAVNAALLVEEATRDGRPQSVAVAQSIQRSTKRMARLIGDLVDVASIDAGKLSVVRRDMDSTSILLEAVETWGPVASRTEIELASNGQGKVSVKVDNDRIQQVIGNLVTNALKVTERGGRIEIGAKEDRGDALFWVKDSGPGIPDDMLEVIFERFWQIGKNDRRGSGLGLYISKCLVEAHGGTIWAESVVGAGSTFFLRIPCEGAVSG